MEEQKRTWSLLVLIAIIIVVGIVAAFLYPKERKAITDTTGISDPLFSSNSETINMSTSTDRQIVVITTNQGDITLELLRDKAPNTVDNFIKLARSEFYNGTLFHRVIKNFMIQGGDPLTKDRANWQIHGTGGPGYKFDDERNDLTLERGVVAMANSGPNTNGSQFFIMTAREPLQLQGYYTAFGRVIDGMDTVEKIESVPVDRSQNDHPTQDMIIESVEVK